MVKLETNVNGIGIKGYIKGVIYGIEFTIDNNDNIRKLIKKDNLFYNEDFIRYVIPIKEYVNIAIEHGVTISNNMLKISSDIFIKLVKKSLKQPFKYLNDKSVYITQNDGKQYYGCIDKDLVVKLYPVKKSKGEVKDIINGICNFTKQVKNGEITILDYKLNEPKLKRFINGILPKLNI